MLRLQDGRKCIYCKKKLDMLKDNYGWHINKNREVEKCYFANMPMLISTKFIKFDKGNCLKKR